MISIIITAWEEPLEVKECLRRLTSQKNLNEDYEIIAIAPDEPTKKEIMKYVKKYPKIVKFISQPREKGKNEMLNILVKKAKGEIIIFTDGDVFVNEIAVSEIANFYKDSRVGAVTGRVLPQNSKKTKMGYWAHLLTYGAHRMRKLRHENDEFIECSGYLYSIRNGIIGDIPGDVAEDSIMPLMISQKGYRVVYAEKAIGRVLYPEDFKKWESQKIRCAKAHDSLDKYGGGKIRMKTFRNEVVKGSGWALIYPNTLKEMYWTVFLFGSRLKIWVKVFIELKIKKDFYGENWVKIHGSKG